MREEKEKKISTDLSSLLEAYENRWVALSPTYDRIISSGDTLYETIGKVDKEERQRVVLYRVLPAGSFYAPLA